MSQTICVPTNWHGVPRSQVSNGFSARPKQEYMAVTIYAVSTTSNYSAMRFIARLRLSYAKFPLISGFMHLMMLLSVTAFGFYVVLGARTFHPYVLLWSLIASTGLSAVIWTAAGEFNGPKEQSN